MASIPVPDKRRSKVLTSVEVDNRDQYPATSRYKSVKYFQRSIPGVGKNIEPETWDPPTILPKDDDLFTEVGPGEVGRIDLIAQRVYGLSSLWWVIALANNLIDPIEEVTSRKVLRYPQFSRVSTEILT